MQKILLEDRPDKSAASKNLNIIIVDIPTHGFLGDTLSTAVNGGMTSVSLRNTLRQANTNAQPVLVTSENTALSAAVLKQALELSEELPKLILFYVGDIKHSDEIATLAQSKSMRYALISYKK